MIITQLITQATNMNNPWTNAYNHPNFVGYTKEQKRTEILNKLSDHDMDWYQWQDVERIVNNESINGY